MGSIPGSGKFPGGERGSPLQYSCQENPMDRGVWRATVHGGSKRQTRLSEHAHGVNEDFTREMGFPGLGGPPSPPLQTVV